MNRWQLRLTILLTATALAPTATFAQTPPVGPPVGSFDTPANNTLGVTGALAITGWALDNTGVTAVNIQRDAHPSDPSGAVVNGRVFVGSASFVTGARPDVANAYSAYPNASRAGWGYLMLTRGLIWDGAGLFRIYAIATDTQGNTTELGSKTISVNNSAATKPFGSIDSPGQGATVGFGLPVTGWVLTPNAGATIPATGVRVAIDGVFLSGVPTMTDRADITTGFPGFDTSGAGRGLGVDTRTILNGTHTIGWFVTDSTGQADGIGSRFFTIANPTFTAGQFVVGKDILPGRYFTDPSRSCYWERQSGLGGTTAEIIANHFISFDAGQLVVDISGNDVAFKTEKECNSWSMAPVRGFATTITPGAWLVNSQLPPGTYSSMVPDGCYWERRRNFDGRSAGIIANEFVSSAGQRFVTIGASDVGFYSVIECGTWTPVSTSLTHAQIAGQPQSPAAIEANWRAHRARTPR